MILVYITCESAEQAKNIGLLLLEKRLCGCINILPEMHSFYYWPSGSGKIEEGNEAVLIVKTTKEKFHEVEKEVEKIHTYKTPCIIAIPVEKVNKKYLDWIEGEVS
jgi:periplasmic divalent cation tolerance protein